MANSDKYSIFEYPPGPRDDPMRYALGWDACEAGLLRPLRRMRHGCRVWEMTSFGESVDFDEWGNYLPDYWTEDKLQQILETEKRQHAEEWEIPGYPWGPRDLEKPRELLAVFREYFDAGLIEPLPELRNGSRQFRGRRRGE